MGPGVQVCARTKTTRDSFGMRRHHLHDGRLVFYSRSTTAEGCYQPTRVATRPCQLEQELGTAPVHSHVIETNKTTEPERKIDTYRTAPPEAPPRSPSSCRARSRRSP